MNFKFHDKRISGLMAVVPANERSFLDEMRNFDFPEARSLKLKEVMGYDKRRLVQPGVCVSDLAVFGPDHSQPDLSKNDFKQLPVFVGIVHNKNFSGRKLPLD